MAALTTLWSVHHVSDRHTLGSTPCQTHAGHLWTRHLDHADVVSIEYFEHSDIDPGESCAVARPDIVIQYTVDGSNHLPASLVLRMTLSSSQK